MTDTYSYISTTYGATNLAAADFVTISNSTAATNPDIEIRISRAAWTGSPAVPTGADLNQVVQLAIQRMMEALQARNISTAGIQPNPS